MKAKITSTLLALIIIAVGLYAWWYSAPKPMFRVIQFNNLPGWNTAALHKSLAAFQTSCRAFIKQDPDQIVGTDDIELQAKDWHPACKAALDLVPEAETAKSFFQKWFSPVEIYANQPLNGLFTGYYMPTIKGSYTKSADYNVPIYEVPKDLVSIDLGLFIPHLKNRKIVGRLENNKVVPYYTREQINKGAIKTKARVLLWMKSPIDRLFLEIQGSGIVELDDGSRIFIGYDGQNGAPYTAIAGVLIKKGVMTKDNASMQAIKRYLQENPEQMDPIINQNKSFVFFRKLNLDGALGSQGVALTPGYSLAVDRQWIPMGAPLWLSTSRPDTANPDVNKPMQRLMVAQDTGGAIKGKIRGDVYWGGGERATLIAGHMKNPGHYWLLLPRHAVSRIQKSV
jgi:membrane-bound lytic murein transglycosylase A